MCLYIKNSSAMYDSGQRAQLDHLYAENALFSLTTTLTEPTGRRRDAANVRSYVRASRNLAAAGNIVFVFVFICCDRFPFYRFFFQCCCSCFVLNL